MLSIPHMIVVFVIVLVIFGPQKLPELARGLGKLMAEFRKASTDFKTAFEEEMRDLERQAREVERRKAAETAAASAQAASQPATLATPSGSETQLSAPPLAGEGNDNRLTEATVITPVAESVARSQEPADALGESPEAAPAPAQNNEENAATTTSPDVARGHHQ